MFVVNLKEHKNIARNFHQHYEMIEREQTGKKPWLNANYYHRENNWLQENFHCTYLPNKNQLVFKNERHYTIFVLRWSS